MKETQWGALAKLQDELVDQQERQQKERQNYHKRLYKQELQAMIDERHKKDRQYHDQDKAYLEFCNQKNKTIEQMESISKSRLKQRIFVSSQHNYDYFSQNKKRLKSQLDQDKSQNRNRFRKIETELTEQKQKQALRQMQKKRQLAEAYERQMKMQNKKKTFERLQNEKIFHIGEEISEENQQRRQSNINKIRFGYSQNPQSYSLLENIYSKQQNKKKDFLDKLEREKTRAKKYQQQELQFQKRNNQHIIQTGKFNKQIFEEKLLKKKMAALSEKEKEQRRMEEIAKNIQIQLNYQNKKRSSLRTQLKDSLESQISIVEQEKAKAKKMSSAEQKLNFNILKGKASVSLPGIAVDFSNRHRQKILENFLVKPHRNTIQYF